MNGLWFFPLPVRVRVGGQTFDAQLEGYHQVAGQFYPVRTRARVTVGGKALLVDLSHIVDILEKE